MLRVYHGGRNPAHRERDQALRAVGIDLTLVVPASWPEGGGESRLSREEFPIVELPVTRPGDVNRHAYRDSSTLPRLIRELEPDALDIHEEPFSVAAQQWLRSAPPSLPVVMYTAQNVDKRYPPPFSTYERRAHRRVAALYPCSRQAASVARGKGFPGLIEVIPLGYDDELFTKGRQTLDADELVLALVGRLVPEKGVRDAVQVVARLNGALPVQLLLVGDGPEEAPALELARTLGIDDRVRIIPWRDAAEVAELYRQIHVVLVPSRPTETWVEQFGRVIVEAQASGAVVAGYASGSIREVAGEAAILVDVGNVAELANRVVRLVEDPADYARRREEGIALCRTRTWARVAEHQRDLYQRVAGGELERLQLLRSPRNRRAVARDEFGSSAETTGGSRPFALPFLRRGGAAASALAALIDATAELAAVMRALGKR